MKICNLLRNLHYLHSPEIGKVIYIIIYIAGVLYATLQKTENSENILKILVPLGPCSLKMIYSVPCFILSHKMSKGPLLVKTLKTPSWTKRNSKAIWARGSYLLRILSLIAETWPIFLLGFLLGSRACI